MTLAQSLSNKSIEKKHNNSIKFKVFIKQPYLYKIYLYQAPECRLFTKMPSFLTKTHSQLGFNVKYTNQMLNNWSEKLAASETNWRRCNSIKLFWIRLFSCTKQTSTIDLAFDYILKMLKANAKRARERYYWLLSIKQNFTSFNSLHYSYIIHFTTHFQNQWNRSMLLNLYKSVCMHWKIH